MKQVASRVSLDGNSQSTSNIQISGSSTLIQSITNNNSTETSDKTKDDKSFIYRVPSKNACFVERKDYINWINQELVKSNVCVLHGLGGVGKTQLVDHFLSDAAEKNTSYALIAKLSANKDVTLQEDLVKLGGKLEIEFIGNNNKEKSQEVLKYLANMQGKALLCYDDAVSSNQVSTYIPENSRHHVIITSVNSGHWGGYATKKIDPMTEVESCELLKKLIGRTVFDEEKAKKLSETLGHLPLAIAQAAVYIKSSSIKIEEYLKRYEVEKQELLKKDLPDNFQHQSTYVAFKLNVQELEKKDSNALALIEISSYCHADQIPLWFLKKFSGTNSEIAFDTLKQSINQFSLLDFDPNADTAAMHCVLQTVCQLLIKDRAQEDGNNAFSALSQLIEWIGNSDNYAYDYDHPKFEENKSLLVHTSSIIDYVANNNIQQINVPPRAFYTLGLFYLDQIYDADRAQHYLKCAIDSIPEIASASDSTQSESAYQEVNQDKKLYGKIHRQYAKVLMRINPEDLEIDKHLKNACQYDPSKENKIKIKMDDLIGQYNKFVKEKSWEEAAKNLRKLADQFKALYSDYYDMQSYIQYYEMKAWMAAFDKFEILISWYEGELEKLEKWKTDKKRWFNDKIRDFESSLTSCSNSIKMLIDQLDGIDQNYPEKIKLLRYRHLARAYKNEKNYQKALSYLEEAWKLKKNVPESQQVTLLIFYAEMLGKMKRQAEAQKILKNELKDFQEETNKEKIKKAIGLHSTSSITQSFFNVVKDVGNAATSILSKTFSGSTTSACSSNNESTKHENLECQKDKVNNKKSTKQSTIPGFFVNKRSTSGGECDESSSKRKRSDENDHAQSKRSRYTP